VVLANTAASIPFPAYEKEMAVKGEMPMCKSTWYSHLDTIMEAVSKVWEEISEEYSKQLVEANEPIVVSADGAWSHRSNANQHEFTGMNAADSMIISMMTVSRPRYVLGKRMEGTGNYWGSSKGMETCCMQRVLEDLNERGVLKLVTHWVSDKDASAAKVLRDYPGSSHIKILYDPGHVKKNIIQFIKRLVKQKKKYHGIAMRFGCFWLRIVKRAENLTDTWENRQRQAVAWMRHIMPHYTKRCGRNCPHYERYGGLEVDEAGEGEKEEEEEEMPDSKEKEWDDDEEDETDDTDVEDDMEEDEKLPDTEQTVQQLQKLHVEAHENAAVALVDVKTGDREVRRFFDPDDKEDQIKIAKIGAMLEKLISQVAKYVHGYSTCNVERIHSERCWYTDKRKELWKHFESYSKQAAIIHNISFKEAAARIMQKLGVPITETNHLLLDRMDRQKQLNRQRQSSAAYRVRKNQLVYERKRRTAEEGMITAAGLPGYKGKAPLYTMQQLFKTKKDTADSVDKENVNPNIPAPAKRKGRPPKNAVSSSVTSLSSFICENAWLTSCEVLSFTRSVLMASQPRTRRAKFSVAQ
jgi:hypothetical protein